VSACRRKFGEARTLASRRKIPEERFQKKDSRRKIPEERFQKKDSRRKIPEERF
jgi:hypothetical protein